MQPAGPLYEMAAHLLLAEVPFSRNRHFEAYQDPRFRRALSLYRRLRSLVHDLELAHRDSDGRLSITEEQRAGRAAVRLEITSSRARRTAWLDSAAYEVLLRHPAARDAVAALLERMERTA